MLFKALKDMGYEMGETLTDVVRAAIYCYEIKIRDIQERWEEVK